MDSCSAFENEPMHLKMKRNEAEYRCGKQLNLAAQPLRRFYVCKRGGFILPSGLSAKKPDSLGVFSLCFGPQWDFLGVLPSNTH